jgi:hypothetical protein
MTSVTQSKLSEEISTKNSTFQVSFTVYFPADTVRCQCSNAGLQFVLMEHTDNACESKRIKKKVGVGEKDKWACSSCLSWLVLHYWTSWILPLRFLMLYFWVVPNNTSHQILKEFGISFKCLLKVTACVDTIFLLLLNQQAGYKYGGNLMHVLSFKMLWTDPNELLTYYQLHESNFWIFWDNPHFHLFRPMMDVPPFCIFSTGHNTFES